MNYYLNRGLGVKFTANEGQVINEGALTSFTICTSRKIIDMTHKVTNRIFNTKK